MTAAPNPDDLPGLKRRDLSPCIECAKGIAHVNGLTFYRVTIERCVIDARAVQQAHGLELMIGSPVLADVMGPDADLAKVPFVARMLVCDACAVRATVCELEEMCNRGAPARDARQARG